MPDKVDFERAAREQTALNRSVAAELWQFLCERKKWWMIPILGALLLFGLLILLSGTGVAPFIYTLF